MNTILRNITGLLLSLLVLAGNGGFTVFIHTCNTQGHVFFYLDDDGIDCDHIVKACCEAPGDHEHQSSGDNHLYITQSDCCGTSSNLVKLEPSTLSSKTEKEVELTKVQSGIILSMFTDALKKDISNHLYNPEQQHNDRIPLLIRKERLKHYSTQKTSSDPLIA